MFQSVPPVPFKLFEETPLNFISSPDGFASMLQKLRNSEELAVDLEHHDYRSYTGFLCLMQISTRDEDWIVDLLALREGLGKLNEVLTNPAVVKARIDPLSVQIVLTPFPGIPWG
jgi:exosome complex exonuclease RRP6